MGLTVIVGIRPEDFVPATGEPAFTGAVNFIEALGEVTLLYVESKHGGDPVIAKLPGIHHEMRGKEVALEAAPAKVHLFANGVSLFHR